MKLFLTIFLAILAAAAVIWGVVTIQQNAAAEKAKWAELERLTKKTIDHAHERALTIDYYGIDKEQEGQCRSTIKDLKETANDPRFSEEIRDYAQSTAQEFEAALVEYKAGHRTAGPGADQTNR